MPKLKAKDIQRAVANLYSKHTVIPNVYLGGFELDLAVISKDWYLTEVEVKVSMSDWRRDEFKKKWIVENAAQTNYYRKRHKVSRFYYAVPSELIRSIPEFVTPETGIIEIYTTNQYIWARIIRESKRIKQNRLNAKEINGLLRAMSFKVWKQHSLPQLSEALHYNCSDRNEKAVDISSHQTHPSIP